MNVKLLINGIDYTNNLQVGFVLKDTCTEELDEMTIILNNVEETKFEPFTDVEITTPIKTFYFYINTYKEDIYDYEQLKYTYTIALISQTKILERVFLPNLKIRKPIKSKSKKTIYDYLSKVIMPYVKKQFSFISLYNYGNELNIECPEIEWNHPTAKQVFNDLFSTIEKKPKLVKIENNVIKYVELSNRGQNVSYLLDSTIAPEHYQQMSDYANNLICDLQNITPDNKNVEIKNISLRAEETARLTTDNCSLIIDGAKIDKIYKLIVKGVQVKEHDTGLTYSQDLDITSFVFEKSVWDSLPTSNVVTARGYKETSLYFTSGSNKIEGFNNKQSFLWSTTLAITNVIIIAAIEQIEDVFEPAVLTNILDLTFDIEFSSIADSRVKVTKTNEESKDCSLYQNQTQSSIDFKAFMECQTEFVNRLGNDTMILTNILPYNEIPNLLDSIGNYILSNREIAFYHDFAIVKSTFTENYIQKRNYYGVFAKTKYTQLANASEIVTREDLYNFDITFTREKRRRYIDLQILIASYFGGVRNKYFRHLAINTDSMGTRNYAYLRHYTFYSGKSVIITAEPYDNYSVGMKVELNGRDQMQNYVSYVDENGEFTSYSIIFFNEEDSTLNSIDGCRNYPIVNDLSNYVLKFTNNSFYKDNGEKLKVTFQFNFKSSDDIFVSNIIALNSALSMNQNMGAFRIYTSHINSVIKDNIELIKRTYKLRNDLTINVIENQISINGWTEEDKVLVKSWIITDSNDNPIIASNTILDETIYVNINKNKII